MKENIILIGMPGSGKSTCGVLAAKALCMQFTDTDLLIQAQYGDTLQNIINTKGIEYFLNAEESVLCGVNERNSIIATGGSAVYSQKAMEHLKQNGTVIYIKISYEEMRKRISNITTRGIVLKHGQTLKNMFDEREALYGRYADITVECDGLTAEQTVEKIFVECCR